MWKGWANSSKMTARLLLRRSCFQSCAAVGLTQRCAQRRYALLEASPRSLQATFFLLCGRRFWRLAGVGLGVEMLFGQRHPDGPVRQEMIRQHADGAATGHAQETRNIFLLFIIAVGETIIRTVNMDFVVGVQRTRRAVSS